MTAQEKNILLFRTPTEWRQWLSKNHTQQEGIWLQMYKKASGKTSVTYAEALDEALCYGWIDGLVNKYDEESYIQKFTPRRKRSLWSEINKGHVARLIKEGKMTDAGLAEVERAKADGRWEAAYGSPANMKVPEDFLQELAKDKKAQEFFNKLNKSNKYAIAWKLKTAKKPETRERRMRVILEMMKKGEKLY